MDILYLLILAIIQGLTEFLPVSSSGHLAMMPALTGSDDQGLLIDVAVHLGTLVAVILYFRADVKSALLGLLDLARAQLTPRAELALMLIIATIPVVILGAVVAVLGWTDHLRNLWVIGSAMVVFGIVLYVMDQHRPMQREMADLTRKDAIALGLWQAVALIPGASRSGMTIAGARARGFSRAEGARFAMLMSIPTIIASGVLVGAQTVAEGNWSDLGAASLAALFACISGLLALRLMMHFLTRYSFTPYVIYRILLGVILLWLAAS